MYIIFEGVRGTGCDLGVRAEGESLFFLGVVGLGDVVRSDATLLIASNFVTASGGGNGDIDSPDTEALWAWYTCIGFSEGTDKTC